MKFKLILTIGLLFIAQSLFSQSYPYPYPKLSNQAQQYYEWRNSNDLFTGAEGLSTSIVALNTLGGVFAIPDSSIGDWTYYVLRTDSTDTDTVMHSNSILTVTGDINLFIRVRKVGANLNAVISYGLWRGPGYSSDGWEWQSIGTATTDTTFEVAITQQAWNSDDPSIFHCIRITQDDGDCGDFIINHVLYNNRR